MLTVAEKLYQTKKCLIWNSAGNGNVFNGN